MWNVLSSLAWRIARDFSSRSGLEGVRDSGDTADVLPVFHLHPYHTQFTQEDFPVPPQGSVMSNFDHHPCGQMEPLGAASRPQMQKEGRGIE